MIRTRQIRRRLGLADLGVLLAAALFGTLLAQGVKGAVTWAAGDPPPARLSAAPAPGLTGK